MIGYDEKGDNAIEPQKLKEGFLYEVRARNANVGIFRKNVNGMDAFEVARYKFGYRLDHEYEWEAHDHLGTAYAIREIGKAEDHKDHEEKLKYLLQEELTLAMDKAENLHNEANRLVREAHWAQEAVTRLIDAMIPQGATRTIQGCEKSPISVCVTMVCRGDECIYCGKIVE